MTDAPRKIGGLTPRTGTGSAPLGRLLRENRDAPQAPAAETSAPEAEPTATQTPRRGARTAKSAKKEPRSQAASANSEVTASGGSKGTVTFYIPKTDRARARATFKATAHLEGDESFSDFLTKAVNAETARREREYGGPFAGGDAPLPTGRPLGS